MTVDTLTLVIETSNRHLVERPSLFKLFGQAVECRSLRLTVIHFRLWPKVKAVKIKVTGSLRERGLAQQRALVRQNHDDDNRPALTGIVCAFLRSQDEASPTLAISWLETQYYIGFSTAGGKLVGNNCRWRQFTEQMAARVICQSPWPHGRHHNRGCGTAMCGMAYSEDVPGLPSKSLESFPCKNPVCRR